MANFDTAFEKTMKHEGFYSFDKHDIGGETYRGISRKYYPEWKGWLIIDEQKPDINREELDPLIIAFYRKHYWNPNLLNAFPQDVANEMFDTGVNLGRRTAAKFLQQALSFLNKNEQLFPDLVEDGIVGPKTLKALEIIHNRKETKLLLKIMNVLQGYHYLSYMKKSPIQEIFARGWFTRVEISKE